MINKHKLVVDRQTADVVQKIFHWKNAGHSAEKICAFLNVLLIPSPYVYKKISGQSYKSVLWTEENKIVYRI